MHVLGIDIQEMDFLHLTKSANVNGCNGRAASLATSSTATFCGGTACGLHVGLDGGDVDTDMLRLEACRHFN